MTSASSGLASVAYAYDALGRRVKRTQLSFGTNTQKYTYDGQDVVLDDTNSTITKYQNGPGIDNKLKTATGSTSQYYLQDHLGSTVALTNSSGSVTESESYDSFGNRTNTTFSNRYQFTGREFDAATGLQYSRARWYDPNIGRFISEDPIGFDGGDVNLYGYVENNPIQYRDPRGFFPSWGPFKHHQGIIRDALTGIAAPSDIDALGREQGDFDANTEDAAYAPWHAMSRPGQDPQAARDEANRYVRMEICLARRLEKMGFHGDAMANLARAMHTMQDSSSPPHFDFQPAWPDSGLGSYWRHRDHYVSEAVVYPFSGADIARQNTRKAWDYFNGAPIPPDVFQGNLYDSIFGPSYSPSNTHSSKGGNCDCEN
jgi:RHS repeat-associated protein